MTWLLAGSAFALLAWLCVLLAPVQAHRIRERLEADPAAGDDLGDVTVIIPARDEAAVIGRAITALRFQGRGLDVVVVDDQSSDDTRGTAARAAGPGLALRVIDGRPLPDGWAGKLWALEQGLAAVERPRVLLLDADIELAPRLVPALLVKARERDATLVSLLAELHCETSWERLLAPAFAFFFKLLYPFAWSNDARMATAAAAGGCMLVRTDALRAIGGFAAIRGALIDDCTLAAALKRHRPPIWLGMSRSVKSLRVYATLDHFWGMVSRSAFTQLRYSTIWLLAATVLMLATLVAPPAGVAAGIVAGEPLLLVTAAAAWLALSAAYWPVVSFYRLPALWAAVLPVAAGLFLAMTWSSAIGYWRGTRASWKARDYRRSPDATRP
jgi:hopene-associated glycosyltransferase HpnB